MSKSASLRARRKAVDRRRRRPVGGGAATPSIDSAKTKAAQRDGVDVAGMLTETALAMAERDRRIRDAAIVGALRSIAGGETPRSSLSIEVYRAMTEQLDRADIDDGARRRAAKELLDILLPNVDRDTPDQLIKYLGLISA